MREENERLKVCEVKVSYTPKVKASERVGIHSSLDAYNILKEVAFDADTIELKEYVKILLTNRANKVLGVHQISEGGTSESTCDIKLILQVAILTNASGIILAHNHPSGTLKPSSQDDVLTNKVKSASELIGINLLDHVIVTNESYYSYADEGRL